MVVKVIVPVRGLRGLRLCLALLTTANVQALKTGKFPRLYASGVRYRRERPEERESWRTIPVVLAEGHGDCEDLASWRAAELRVSGEDPQARPFIYRTRSGSYHVVVRRGDGEVEDPSRLLGMTGME